MPTGRNGAPEAQNSFSALGEQPNGNTGLSALHAGGGNELYSFLLLTLGSLAGTLPGSTQPIRRTE